MHAPWWMRPCSKCDLSVPHTIHGPFPSDKIDTEEARFPVQEAVLPVQGRRRSFVFCSNCGSSSHNSKAMQTDMQELTLKNHFAKVCRLALATQASQKRRPSASNDCTEIRHVSVGQIAFRTCNVLLGEVSLPLLMDTGAAVSQIKIKSNQITVIVTLCSMPVHTTSSFPICHCNSPAHPS